MPTVTMTFKLPEEQVDFSDAVHGEKYKIILHEITEKARGMCKHGPENLSKHEMYQAMWDIYNSYNFDPFMGESLP